MSVRYIGSKARIVDDILSVVGAPSSSSGVFVDAFCGTGAVAEAAARAGWSIRLNDHLLSAVTMAHARLVSPSGAKFQSLGGYANAIATLNEAKPRHGFLWKEYSPASASHAGVARMYFTMANAARIDGIRHAIGKWSKDGLLTTEEERLVLADLLLATNRVANIAGTYGCFLSHWSPQSQERLTLKPRALFPRRVEVLATVNDVRHLVVGPADVVYLDPPYTKRQYAAYYHVLETIAAGDAPTVTGITGLRPWQEKASDFCYRARALKAIVDLVERQQARRILLSYSNEGHVEMKPLTAALKKVGDVSIEPLRSIGRYRPNRAASDAGDEVTEYLLTIRRTAKSVSQVAA